MVLARIDVGYRALNRFANKNVGGEIDLPEERLERYLEKLSWRA